MSHGSMYGTTAIVGLFYLSLSRGVVAMRFTYHFIGRFSFDYLRHAPLFSLSQQKRAGDVSLCDRKSSGGASMDTFNANSSRSFSFPLGVANGSGAVLLHSCQPCLTEISLGYNLLRLLLDRSTHHCVAN